MCLLGHKPYLSRFLNHYALIKIWFPNDVLWLGLFYFDKARFSTHFKIKQEEELVQEK